MKLRGPWRPAAAVLCSVLLLGVASACGSSEKTSASGDPDNVYLPTENPTVSVTMLAAPDDYSTIEGAGFEISAPGEFQRQTTTSANQEPMLVLEKPSAIESVPQRVAVIRDVEPQQSADEQSFALETAKSAAGPEGEVVRISMPAPEGQSAFLTMWRESRPSSDSGNVEVTYWQLMHQVDDSLIFNVVAFAPSDEFETSEVSRILRTFVADQP